MTELYTTLAGCAPKMAVVMLGLPILAVTATHLMKAPQNHPTNGGNSDDEGTSEEDRPDDGDGSSGGHTDSDCGDGGYNGYEDPTDEVRTGSKSARQTPSRATWFLKKVGQVVGTPIPRNLLHATFIHSVPLATEANNFIFQILEVQPQMLTDEIQVCFRCLCAATRELEHLE